MTSNSSQSWETDRERTQALADALRSERLAKRARVAAERRERVRKAHETGAFDWFRDPYPGLDAGLSLPGEFERPDGSVGAGLIRPGVVTLINPRCRGEDRTLPYDFRVRIGWGDALEEADGVVRVHEEDVRPVVEEVAILRRPGGDPVTARGVQASRLGDVTRLAVQLLTFWEDDGRLVQLSPDSAGELLRSPARRRKARAGSEERRKEVELVAELYKEAVEKGVPRRRYIRDHLVKRWRERGGQGSAPHLSEATIKARIAEARRSPGLLRLTSGTRPRLLED